MRLFPRKAYAGHGAHVWHGANGRLSRLGRNIVDAGESAGKFSAQAFTSCRRGLATLRVRLHEARGNAVRFQRSSADAVQELSGGVRKSARMVRKSAKVMQKSVKKARKEFK